jgi:hypothetical protein
MGFQLLRRKLCYQMNRARFVSEDGLIIEGQLDIHEATDTLRRRMGHLWSLPSRLLEKR